MSTFTVSVDVGDPTAQRFEPLDALVDTGSSHTSLPGRILRNLGVSPHELGRFRLATGDIVEREIGRTWMRLDGRLEMVIVVFGNDNAPPLLGAITLEQFGLGVDPVSRTVSRVPWLLA